MLMVDRSTAGDDEGTEVSVTYHGDGSFTVAAGSQGTVELSSASLSADGTLVATVTDDSCVAGLPCLVRATCVDHEGAVHVFDPSDLSAPHMYEIELPSLSFADAAGGSGRPAMTAPMPGQLTQLFVSVGDRVSAGDRVCVLVAMKMENVIRAPCDAVITSVPFAEGEMVDGYATLIEFEAVADGEE